MNSINFYFNGESSSNYGVAIVNTSNGLLTHNFLPKKSVKSETIAGSNKRYIYGIERSPLQFTIQLVLINDQKWTLEKRREIARWLDRDNFCEYYREDEQEKRYYVTYVDGIELSHNAAQDGYLTVTFENESDCTYSPYVQKEYSVKDKLEVEVINSGDESVFPELWIEKVGKGSFEIVNLTNGGSTFKIDNLMNTETIYVDNQWREIESSLAETYRYDDFNGTYFQLVRGHNRLIITGTCELTIRYQTVIKG